MLTREQLEASYLEHVASSRAHLDAVRSAKSPVVKGFHIAEALCAAQLATAAATALANHRISFRPAVLDRSDLVPNAQTAPKKFGVDSEGWAELPG